jgi:hypothetical protein
LTTNGSRAGGVAGIAIDSSSPILSSREKHSPCLEHGLVYKRTIVVGCRVRGSMCSAQLYRLTSLNVDHGPHPWVHAALHFGFTNGQDS